MAVAVTLSNGLLNSLLCTLLLAPSSTKAEPAFPGGRLGTASIEPRANFLLPLSSLTHEQKLDFYAGRALAQQAWITAPATTDARDGLGPIYNARTCLACHIKGGRGTLPERPNQRMNTAVIKIANPQGEQQKHLGVSPHPIYGGQLQTQSVALRHQIEHMMPGPSAVRPEAYITLQWKTKTDYYPDGTAIELRHPQIDIEQLGYGPIEYNLVMSLRIAPALFGLGLLEAIPLETLEQRVDPNDTNGDGISGRLNRVWNIDNQTFEAGLFGLKSARPNISHAVAAAFQSDIGITNFLFPKESCTTAQTACVNAPNGNNPEGVELSRALLNLVRNFSAHLAVPAARALPQKQWQTGSKLFESLGCAACHTPSLSTGKTLQGAVAADQIIWPYTDLLLHDMGEPLSDQYPEYAATGNEWRTAPLWGIGLQPYPKYLLHDGRARSVEEAIWWHGGEASKSKNRFIALPKKQRNNLLQFIESL